MLEKRRIKRKGVFTLFSVLTILFCLCCAIASITYANSSLNTPDVIVMIDRNGQTSCKGNLFGNDLWYPDKKVSGVIRIYNNFRTVLVRHLGVGVTLDKCQPGMDSNAVYRSFLDNMKLSVTKGKYFLFDQPLFTDRSLSQLNGNFPSTENEQEESDSYVIEIPGKDSIDLNYSLYMDKNAGDELENLAATVNLEMNINEEIPEE